MSTRISLPKDWAKPLVVQPVASHEQTLIVLHGRGDWAENFAPVLLRMPLQLPSSSTTGQSGLPVSRLESTLSSEHTQSPSRQPDKPMSAINMPNALPHTRFIFLTAPMRSCTMMNGRENRQWFDNFSLKDPETRQDLQIAGLRETINVVDQLIKEEIQDSISLGKTLQFGLMGFSQGAAASIISALILDAGNENARGSLSAVVSMSGWLPFRGLLERREEKGGNETGHDEEMSFRLEHLRKMLRADGESSTVGHKNVGDKYTQIADPTSSPPIPALSFLLCHGIEDGHVNPTLSRLAAKSLHDLGVADVVSKEYVGLDHFVNKEEIGDAVEFLRNKFGETKIV